MQTGKTPLPLQVWEESALRGPWKTFVHRGRLEASISDANPRHRCRAEGNAPHNCTTSCVVLSALSVHSMTLHLHSQKVGVEFPKPSQGGLRSPYFEASDLEESFLYCFRLLWLLAFSFFHCTGQKTCSLCTELMFFSAVSGEWGR